MPCPCLSTDLAHVCCTHFKPKKNAIFFFFQKLQLKKKKKGLDFRVYTRFNFFFFQKLQ